MSNASLKEQLQAMASQLSDKTQPDKARKPSNPHTNPAKKQSERAHAIQKQKPKWLDYAQYGVELLRTFFPDCFKMGSEVKPLKKGIKQDLVKRLSEMNNMVTEDKACMVKSLSYYVNIAAYHKSVVVGATRIDLDGQPAGDVTTEEAHYSFERCQAKLQAKQSRLSNRETQKKEEVTA